MKTDVAGKVRNTSLAQSRPLLPLFEAVVNSIQAIEEAGREDGVVGIKIVRNSNHLFADSASDLGEIDGFEIVDNGVGFNEANFEAFCTADTTYKADRGGRGNGRFMWLKAFSWVDVESHFIGKAGIRERSFVFTQFGDGIGELDIRDSDRTTPETKVRLRGFEHKYQVQCPKRCETIASHIIEHCLEYFIRPDCPVIKLMDEAANEVIELNERFDHEVHDRSQRETISIMESDFNVLHVRIYSPHVADHMVHFCANNRVVRSEKVCGQVPNVTRRLSDHEGKDFVYAAYVDSDALDEAVNAERTDFAIPESDNELLEPTLCWRAIKNGLFDRSGQFLEVYTAPIKEKKERRIQEFVETDGPMYRPILKHIQDQVNAIEPEISNDALDLKLYQATHELQLQLRYEGRSLLQQASEVDDYEAFSDRLQAYFAKVTDVNASDLARYVCHRWTVLEFLKKRTSWDSDGKYPLEDRVHQIIVPMGCSSDDEPFSQHNLWVLDETLAYHRFLASDKALCKVAPLITDSKKEPDILVFDKACAFSAGDAFSSITIVEFKRPMRDQYSEKENPFSQICGYIDLIRDGKARTRDGRPVEVPQGTPFFCFVVADGCPQLTKWARLYELEPAPDGRGFFGFKSAYNAYFEVVSYDKMIDLAEKRNDVFFAKLGLKPSKFDR